MFGVRERRAGTPRRDGLRQRQRKRPRRGLVAAGDGGVITLTRSEATAGLAEKVKKVVKEQQSKGQKTVNSSRKTDSVSDMPLQGGWAHGIH